MTHPDRPTTEKVLREAGFSNRQAKKLLSGGWRLVVSDEEADADDLIDAMEKFRERLITERKGL